MESNIIRLKSRLPLILVLIGAAIIGAASWAKIETWSVQRDLLKEYDGYIARLEQVSAALPALPAGSGTDPVPAVAGVETIGVLRIPKIDLTVALGEGTDKKTLKYTAGHFPETAKPGEIGNFAVIGHRSYTYAEFFNRLDEVEAGDLITVQSGANTYTYTVTEVFVVEPEEIWVLDPTDDAEITLITCTPIRVATHRLIVKGVLTETE